MNHPTLLPLPVHRIRRYLLRCTECDYVTFPAWLSKDAAVGDAKLQTRIHNEGMSPEKLAETQQPYDTWVPCVLATPDLKFNMLHNTQTDTMTIFCTKCEVVISRGERWNQREGLELVNNHIC